jgi:hypothetical protein
LRKERLKKLTEESHLFKTALVPRLKEIDRTQVDFLSKAFERIKPDDGEAIESGNKNKTKDRIIRVAMSDFEEVFERQRFLKYDLMWQRAENAFIEKKRLAMAE